MGGDFNDNEPPNLIMGIKRSFPKILPRFNNKGRENTIIDHFYSQEKLEVGTIAVLRKHEEFEEAKNFRN